MAQGCIPPVINVEIDRYLWSAKQNQFQDMFLRSNTALKLQRTLLVNKYKRNPREPQIGPLTQPIGKESRDYPGLSSKVVFENGQNNGRKACLHLVNRNETLPACTTIGAVKAFASVIDKTEEPYCLTCHQQKYTNYTDCIACHNVLFCGDRNCRIENRTHEYECGSNFHNVKFGSDINIKCAIQMVFESLAAFQSNVEDMKDRVEDLLNGQNQIDTTAIPIARTAQDKFACIMQLQGSAEQHLEGQSCQAFQFIMQLPQINRLFDDDEDKHFLQQLLMHFLKILNTNSFEDESAEGILECTIFDSLSLFNHSCSPNLIHIFRNTKMYLISSRRIKSEEELCFSYKIRKN